MGQQTAITIPLDGGLDLSSTYIANQQRPGTCRTLINFENNFYGGYRRVNGYTKYGTAQPTGSDDEIFAVHAYADGVVAVASTGVYFSTNGNSWLQVNRDTYEAQTGTVEVTNTSGSYIDVVGSGTAFLSEFVVGETIRINGNYREIASIPSNTSMTLATEISGGVSAGEDIEKNGTLVVTASGGSVIPRTNQGKSMIAWLEEDGEYGSLVITDITGNNSAAWFKITGTGVNRKYYYDTLSAAGFAAPSSPKYCVTFEQRVVVANNGSEQNTVYWSDRLQNKRFDGASAGSVAVDSPIVSLYPFRDRLIIFCRNSIFQLTNINSIASIAVLPISYNIGCAATFSVQELGGDIIFLSNDGIRTLSATDQYGDVQFAVVSRNINKTVNEVLASLGSLNISSTVIKNKNQYRLFYTNSQLSKYEQLGIIGTLKSGQAGLEWQWSRLQGFEVSCLNNIVQDDVGSQELVYHGGYNGRVYVHDDGNSLDGDRILAKLELNEINFGDDGTKKTVHYINVHGVSEGVVNEIFASAVYDFKQESTIQPTLKRLASLNPVSFYGRSVYGTAVYGGLEQFSRRVVMEGSGYTLSFICASDSTESSYVINSLYVDLRIGSKL